MPGLNAPGTVIGGVIGGPIGAGVGGAVGGWIGGLFTGGPGERIGKAKYASLPDYLKSTISEAQMVSLEHEVGGASWLADTFRPLIERDAQAGTLEARLAGYQSTYQYHQNLQAPNNFGTHPNLKAAGLAFISTIYAHYNPTYDFSSGVYSLRPVGSNPPPAGANLPTPPTHAGMSWITIVIIAGVALAVIAGIGSSKGGS